MMTDDIIISIIGYIAAVLTTAASLPQIIKTISTKDTQSISLCAIITLWFGIVFWIVFGILLANWVIIISNTISIIQYTALIILKCVFDYKRNHPPTHHPIYLDPV